MKLVGDLKTKVEKAPTMDEKKAVIADAGMELNDEELNSVAGGGRVSGTRATDENFLRSISSVIGGLFTKDSKKDTQSNNIHR